jgi:hypothetical protein
MAETTQQTWPPTGRVRFLGFTQDGQATATFQDLDYANHGATRKHVASGLPDLTSPDVFSITQAAATRHYGESYEQQGRADASAGLHPWLADRTTAEAMRERAGDSRVLGDARQRAEAIAAERRGDKGAWTRLPPAQTRADTDRLARLFSEPQGGLTMTSSGTGRSLDRDR